MEHLTEAQIASYRARSLSASEMLDVSDHLAECEACRVLVSQDAGLAVAAASLYTRLRSESEAFSHLTYDELAAYVDGAASDAGRVDRHIRDCASCAANLRDLGVAKAELARDRAPAPAFWSAIRGWRAAFALAAAAACALVIGIALRPRPSAPAARVEPPPQARAPSATVILDGSRQITITAQGSVSGLDGLPDGIRTAVERALMAQRVDVPTFAGLSGRRDVLLGAPAAPKGTKLLEPVGILIETPTPVFRWKAVPGAEYQVSVYTSDFQPAVSGGWIRGAQWRSAVALRRGTRYSWQLTVRRDGAEVTSPVPPEPEAKFQVLDAASEDSLARLRATSKDSHLVMGIAYAQAGLLDQARLELRAAADQNPGSTMVAALLAAINSDRPRSK
ncbi:MAG TPA: hypothetical protein VMJ75_31020 [Candidatus Acidoferrales bacterium]|nr:hypothetical protein [Candidatus Acidoferrales bacterium]